jgi:hypothetical protein
MGCLCQESFLDFEVSSSEVVIDTGLARASSRLGSSCTEISIRGTYRYSRGTVNASAYERRKLNPEFDPVENVHSST